MQGFRAEGNNSRAAADRLYTPSLPCGKTALTRYQQLRQNQSSDIASWQLQLARGLRGAARGLAGQGAIGAVALGASQQ